MSRRERDRLKVIEAVREKRLKQNEAASSWDSGGSMHGRGKLTQHRKPHHVVERKTNRKPSCPCCVRGRLRHCNRRVSQ